MLKTATLTLGLLLCVVESLQAQAVATHFLEVERLADGRTLMVDAGVKGSVIGSVRLVDEDGTLDHAWQTALQYPHSAELIDEEHILVTDTKKDRVLILSPDGGIAWNSKTVEPFSDGSSLLYPNDATLLDNGHLLISDMDNARVIELDLRGKVHWQFGETGVAANDSSHLNGPHSPERLANGNTLIADAHNDRLLEVDSSGNVVWQLGPSLQGGYTLDSPRDIDVLPNGDFAIAAFHNFDVLVVTRNGWIRLRKNFSAPPYDVDYLENGNLLVGVGNVQEIDASGQVVWQYPPAAIGRVEPFTVHNPVSAVKVYGELHLPESASATSPVPVVVMVPDVFEDGSHYHQSCEEWARLGFAAVHWDPDGRGQSTNNGQFVQDNYEGYVHQQSLSKVVDLLSQRDDILTEQIVLRSKGHGLATATGAIARFPQSVEPSLLLDYVGHASSEQSSYENGGPIPYPAMATAFWQEREAINFMPYVTCSYLRIQPEQDPISPTNDYVVGLLQKGLNNMFGGTIGHTETLQVNSYLENPAEFSWSASTPPKWIDNELTNSPYLPMREHFEIQKHLSRPSVTLGGIFSPGGFITIKVDAGAKRAKDLVAMSLSGGVAHLELPGGGWSNLLPDSIMAITSKTLTLNQNGVVNSAWSIPNNPSLSGQTLYAQSQVIHGLAPVRTSVSLLQAISLN